MNWKIDRDGDYVPNYKPKHSADRLPAGVYTPKFPSMSENFLKKKEFITDELIEIEDSVASKVTDSIQQFWQSKDKFVNAGYIWKRGIMLWGPPGSGKTCISMIVANWAVKQDAIVLNINGSGELKAALNMVREIEKDRPIVTILEEVDTFSEGKLLSVLDGADQHQNVIHIATTNYPEKMSSRLTNRPSRFDEILFVDFPVDEVREEFLKRKSNRFRDNDIERKKVVDATAGMSIAHLREILVAVECLDRSINDAIQQARDMFTNKNNSNRWESKMVKS